MHLISIENALRGVAPQRLPLTDARMLMLHLLGRPVWDRAWLVLHGTDKLAESDLHRFHVFCHRLMAGEPVAYIIGSKAFYGMELCVDARVLDPRADTETLVDWACEVLADFAAPRVLDLGTGSGAVALAICKTCPAAAVDATDTSTAALEVAQLNAERLGLAVNFASGDWFNNALCNASRYALIVSNPPYIAVDDPHLSALSHEPQQALVSGSDGLDAIRLIVAGAPAQLEIGGWLLLEHGYDQAEAVHGLMVAQGFDAVQHRFDLAGIARCTGGQFRASGETDGGAAATVK